MAMRGDPRRVRSRADGFWERSHPVVPQLVPLRTRRNAVKRFLALLAAGATATGLTVLAGPPAAAATGCKVEYTVTSQWEGGFQGGVKVTNLGDSVSGWQLKFTLSGSGQKVV